MALIVRGMQANDCFEEQMQRTKKEFVALVNAARKKHADDMVAGLALWYNEESIMMAFWDADFIRDDAWHKFKSQSTASSPTTHNCGNCRSQWNACM